MAPKWHFNRGLKRRDLVGCRNPQVESHRDFAVIHRNQLWVLNGRFAVTSCAMRISALGRLLPTICICRAHIHTIVFGNVAARYCRCCNSSRVG